MATQDDVIKILGNAICIPRYFGQPLYFAHTGAPLTADKISHNNILLYDIYYQENKVLEGEQLEVLKNYILYYITAPCWTITPQKREQIQLECMAIKEEKDFNYVLDLMQDFGIDPF